mmetsp:Transcript_5934/g.19952  ORF Transcript_5934/g.19952 Transcript_5934/m.19952 type:complete len:229 (-) Transcript_5934:37-723(-)
MRRSRQRHRPSRGKVVTHVTFKLGRRRRRRRKRAPRRRRRHPSIMRRTLRLKRTRRVMSFTHRRRITTHRHRCRGFSLKPRRLVVSSNLSRLELAFVIQQIQPIHRRHPSRTHHQMQHILHLRRLCPYCRRRRIIHIVRPRARLGARQHLPQHVLIFQHLAAINQHLRRAIDDNATTSAITRRASTVSPVLDVAVDGFNVRLERAHGFSRIEAHANIRARLYLRALQH